MKYTSGKTSTWLALRNPVYSKLWFAMVISGSWMAAQNTAIYWALNALGATTVLISLMATVSALPGALFTLPAGAIADMVNRKKILLAVQLWHAAIAIGLAILWTAHLLNPYLILTGAFLFSLGFAFSAPVGSDLTKFAPEAKTALGPEQRISEPGKLESCESKFYLIGCPTNIPQ
jgi:MFS family permease